MVTPRREVAAGPEHRSPPPTTSGHDAEYDALRSDGRLVHIRPLRSSDERALVALVENLSERSAYQRFFSTSKVNRHYYLEQLLRPGRTLSAVVATAGSELVGIGSLHPYDEKGAEIALLVSDVHQGEGIGTLLLEDLAERARLSGIRRIVAEVFPGNSQMLRVLREAGYESAASRPGDTVTAYGALDATDDTIRTLLAREQHADAASLRRVLRPASVVVVGAGSAVGDEPGDIGRHVVRNLLGGGFRGRVAVVNASGSDVDGVTGYRSVTDVPGAVDLVVVAVPGEQILDIARDCASRGVTALVVVSSPPAEATDVVREWQHALLSVARAAGMRLVGPHCLGVVNTAADVRLDATFVARRPAPGAVGVFTQADTVGVAVLDELARRSLGISTLVSAGDKLDVSGNDMLMYWADDASTSVAALYLESFGNPRKFARVVRNVSRSKPVVAVTAGWSDVTIGAVFDQAGVIRARSIRELADVVKLLTSQPQPRGPRVAVVGNCEGPAGLTTDACAAAGLVLAPIAANPVDLTARGTADELADNVSALLADSVVDAVVVVWAAVSAASSTAAAEAVRRVATSSVKPVTAVVLGIDTGADWGGVPVFELPEDAIRAIGHAWWRATWCARPEPTLREPPPRGIRRVAARRLVRAAMSQRPAGSWLDPERCTSLLHEYGLRAGAVAANADDVEVAIGVVCDPDFGPVVTVGRCGDVSRLPPITRDVARRMADSVLAREQASDRTTKALVDVLRRVGRLAEDVPELADLRLARVVLGGDATVDGIRIRLAPTPSDSGIPLVRRLRE